MFSFRSSAMRLASHTANCASLAAATATPTPLPFILKRTKGSRGARVAGGGGGGSASSATEPHVFLSHTRTRSSARPTKEKEGDNGGGGRDIDGGSVPSPTRDAHAPGTVTSLSPMDALLLSCGFVRSAWLVTSPLPPSTTTTSPTSLSPSSASPSPPSRQGQQQHGPLSAYTLKDPMLLWRNGELITGRIAALRSDGGDEAAAHRRDGNDGPTKKKKTQKDDGDAPINMNAANAAGSSSPSSAAMGSSPTLPPFFKASTRVSLAPSLVEGGDGGDVANTLDPLHSAASDDASPSSPAADDPQPPTAAADSLVLLDAIAGVLAAVKASHAEHAAIAKAEAREARRWAALRARERLLLVPSPPPIAVPPSADTSSALLPSSSALQSPHPTHHEDYHELPAGPSFSGGASLANLRQRLQRAWDGAVAREREVAAVPTCTMDGAAPLSTRGKRVMMRKASLVPPPSPKRPPPEVVVMPKGGLKGLVLRDDEAVEGAPSSSSAVAAGDINVNTEAVKQKTADAADVQSEADIKAAALAAAEELSRLTDTLNASQRRVLDLSLKGYSMFLGGDAGTGKSFLLRVMIGHLRDRLGLSVAVTGSTGIAALNIGGVTFHSLFGMGPVDEGLGTFPYQHHHHHGGGGISGSGAHNASSPPRHITSHRQRKAVAELLRGLDVLILDEVSMLSERDLRRLSEAARAARRGGMVGRGGGGKSPPPLLSSFSSSSPLSDAFGGIQVIFSGDFLQLKAIEGVVGGGGGGALHSVGGMPITPVSTPLFASPLFQSGLPSLATPQPAHQTPTTSINATGDVAVGGAVPSVAPTTPSYSSAAINTSATEGKGPLLHLRLTETMRQANDKEFLAALNSLRVGELTPLIADSATLNPFHEGATRLYAKRSDAARFNAQMMGLIDSPAVSFPSKITHTHLSGQISDLAMFSLRCGAGGGGEYVYDSPSSFHHQHNRSVDPLIAKDANALATWMQHAARQLALDGALDGAVCSGNDGGSASSGDELTRIVLKSFGSSSFPSSFSSMPSNGGGAGRSDAVDGESSSSSSSSASRVDFYIVAMPPEGAAPPAATSSSNNKGGGAEEARAAGGSGALLRYSVRCGLRSATSPKPSKGHADALLRCVLKALEGGRGVRLGRGGGGGGPYHHHSGGVSAGNPLVGKLRNVTIHTRAHSSGDALLGTETNAAVTSTMAATDNAAGVDGASDAAADPLHDVSKRVVTIARGELARDSTLGQKVLKEGCKVMLLRNLASGSGLVNGRQGTVVGFEAMDPHSEHFAPIRPMFRLVKVLPPPSPSPSPAEAEAEGSPAAEEESVDVAGSSSSKTAEVGDVGGNSIDTDAAGSDGDPSQPKPLLGGTADTAAVEAFAEPPSSSSSSKTSSPSTPLPFTKPLRMLVPVNRVLSPQHLHVPVPIVRFDDGTTSYVPYVQLPLENRRSGVGGGGDNRAGSAGGDASSASPLPPLPSPTPPPPPPTQRSSNITVSVATVPLVPAYAFTVHKIQGLTLSDPIIVDCRGMWPCEHIIYVAASRVKRREHLRIIGLREELVLVDSDALAFTRACPTVEEVCAALGVLGEQQRNRQRRPREGAVGVAGGCRHDESMLPPVADWAVEEAEADVHM